MNINEIHIFIQDVARKERNSFVSHPTIDSFLQRSQLEVFEAYFKDYGEGQSTKDALAAFKSLYEFTYATSPRGVVTLPSNYLHLNGGSYITYYDNVRNLPGTQDISFVNEDKLNYALNSQVRPVSKTWPLGINRNGVIQLFPKVPQTGVINYFRVPAVPKFAFTENGRQIVYDAANSTQLEWNEIDKTKIIMKSLEYLGITYSESDLINFAEMKAKTV